MIFNFFRNVRATRQKSDLKIRDGWVGRCLGRVDPYLDRKIKPELFEMCTVAASGVRPPFFPQIGGTGELGRLTGNE